MGIFIAVLLGIIQGITEFLPVSSSGHVLIFSRIFQTPSSFEFDVLVSFGTLFAVLIYYRQRFKEIVLDLVKRKDPGLAIKLIVATLPAIFVGYFFKDFIELYLHNTSTAIVMVIVIGILMIVSSRWKPDKNLPVNKDLHQITYWQVLAIGCAQCVSLISGSSRSGVTMLAAIKMGFQTKTAAEWSFLMSVPAIAGASLRVLITPEGMNFVQTETVAFVVSNVISFVAGIAAIHILLKILQRKGLYWFGWYRIVLGTALILLMAFGIL